MTAPSPGRAHVCSSSTTTGPSAMPSPRCSQKAGYATDQAGDGVDALARLRSGPVDLMLLDIGLPG